MNLRHDGFLNSVKIAVLWKRSQCLRRFTKPNYRHRVFVLTEQALSYYTGTIDRIGSLKGRVPLDSIRAVELVDTNAFGLEHTLQIVYHNKKHGHVTLYVTARDKEECDDWMVTLRQVCYFNQDMLMHFHSGCYTGSKWTCCHKQCQQTLGCEPTFFLLTKSSSRYAQSKREETVMKLNRKSIIGEEGVNGSATDLVDCPMVDDNISTFSRSKSTSCHNLTDAMFPSNFSITKDAQMSSLSSFYTTNAMDLSPKISMTAIIERRDNFFNSMETGCNRHQVAPLTEPGMTMYDTFPRKRRSTQNYTYSPLITATKCYIIQGRSSSRGSSISREPSIDQDCNSLVAPPIRKTSIEPKLSQTNPDVIHV